MRGILGEEFNQFLHALNEPEQKGILVNTNKIQVERFKDIIDFEVSAIPYERAGFCVDNIKLGHHPLHHAGAFYVQDPSAMFTVNSFKFNGNERVLDMCASPGGKTIQIANRLSEGVLVSNEINPSRSQVLFSNVERMGLKNVVVCNDTPKTIAKAYGNYFDVVLVDAPCSGEGMFRRGQKVVDEWNENLPKMCAERQIEILHSADKVLKQGGHIIYSTCTYSVEENEDVASQFARENGYELVNIQSNLSRGIGVPEAVRLYPHCNRGEGQFVAVMRKVSENEQSDCTRLRLKRDPLAKKFVKDNIDRTLDLYKYKNFSYYIKDCSIIKEGVNYVSLGVRIGEEKNNLFTPNHNLFTAFGGEFKRKTDLKYDSLAAKKYLRGEALEHDFSDGFGVVLIENCPVGGFKISAGKFKNHYPKGLREG